MNEISLCMIVKNEENNLRKCLSCIASYMDEIIIVDTGSTDRTKEVAYRYTDNVYDFVWIDDFAAARNYSISKATKDFILVLDSDEFAQTVELLEIKRLIGENPFNIGRLLCVNEISRNGVSFRSKERIKRLFPRKLYQYKGAVHEQIVPIIEDNKLDDREAYPIPLTIIHTGYDGTLEIRKKKSERNIKLLKIEQERYPEDPYILYQLGKSYYMEEDYANAYNYFGQALYCDLDPRLDYVQDMVESYGYSMLNTEKYEDALQLLNIYDEFSHSADFVFMLALVLMNNGKFNESIREFLKAAEKPDAKMEGVNGYLAYYNIGIIFECLGDINGAIKYFEKCGNYEAAKKRLEILNN